MDEPEILPDATRNEEKKSQPVKKSKEAFFGTLLFMGMIVVILAIILGIAWGAYYGFRSTKQQSALPSIGNLAMEEKKEEVKVEEVKPTAEENKEQGEKDADKELRTKAKNTDIKALNGGAAKGSAGVVAELLKKDGFTKVTPGNTLADYTGTVVYYAADLEKEAGIVKEALLKNYPKTEVKAAVKTNTETTQAPIVVIVGR